MKLTDTARVAPPVIGYPVLLCRKLLNLPRFCCISTVLLILFSLKMFFRFCMMKMIFLRQNLEIISWKKFEISLKSPGISFCESGGHPDNARYLIKTFPMPVFNIFFEIRPRSR